MGSQSRRASRRSSSLDRVSRRGSLVSIDSSFVEDNNHEMYSGAASEVIPSSISSLHYPHHFSHLRRGSSKETSPLLVAAHDEENELHTVNSNSTSRSVDTQTNFKFFSIDEIETAPGGSTLENPEDPIDYNTDWNYNLDKYDSQENLLGSGSAINDERESYGSIREDDLYNRRNSGSDKADSISSASVAHDEDMKRYPSICTYQRYYLAEEDLVIGIAGYQNCLWKLITYYVICIFTGGIGYLVMRWMPKYQINLKGNQSSLGSADWLVIENEFGELSTVVIEKTKFGEPMTNFLVTTTDDDSDDVIADDPVISVIHSFKYRYLKFFYNPVEDLFKTNSNWYDTHWLNYRHLKEGISQSLQERRLAIFEENNIEIEEKSVVQLLVDEILHPFYVFQIFSIFLWLADDYYYYALCIFIISFISIVNTLVETKSTIRRLQQISKFKCDIRVWRNDFWKQIDSNELVPGDVFEIDTSLSVIPCDALLINGECVINESMLTGESVPVSKTSANHDTVKHLRTKLSNSSLAKSFLYNGTKLLKMKSTNDEPVMAMVVKTGFNTTKGSLVRSMLFPKPTGFKFYQDSFKYIGFMTVIAFIGFIYSTYNFIKLGLPKSLMILRALDIITIVVPPALPATLTIGTTFAMNRLKKYHQIFCIAPTRVNIGGKLDVICFDKTGTLTEDGLDVLGVHGTHPAAGRKQIVFENLLLSPQTTDYLIMGMATCHSLRLIDNELLGDPLDMKMFEFTTWKYSEEADFPRVSNNDQQLKIVKEFDFVSGLRRMSVIAEAANGQQYVFSKGAPEVMVDICDGDSIPADYEELLYQYTHNGYRVIACAHKQLRSPSNDRDEVESQLTFSGFIIFENKLKPSTKETLLALNEAKIRTVMCTGDNILTAISVGRESGLLSENDAIYIPRWDEEEEDRLVWHEINNPDNKLDSDTLRPVGIRHEINDYKLAVTGDVFKYILLENGSELVKHTMLMKGDIFARMSPDEKHELVEQLQKIDYTVGFVGDGANDCGALKAADVGISLSEAEASVAAPFTSRNFEIKCVLDVIKEGRSSLVTSFSCFKYMSLYSAIQFVTVSILYKRGTNLGDFQFLYIDLFLILPLAIFMSWSQPYHKIIVKRPTANLVSPKILIPLMCHIAVILAFQVAIWLYVQTEPWYIKPVPGGDDEVKSSDNTVLFLFTNFQYILIAVVLSKGPPYRSPIHENWPFLVNLILATAISTSLFLIPQDSWLGDFMQLTNLGPKTYGLLVVTAAGNLLLMKLGEDWWFPNLARVYKRIRLSVSRGLASSKKTFKNLLKEFTQVEIV